MFGKLAKARSKSRPTTAAADSTWIASADRGANRRPIPARRLSGTRMRRRPGRSRGSSAASRRVTSRTNSGLPWVASWIAATLPAHGSAPER